MTSIDPQLIQDNLTVLRQGRVLLSSMDEGAYCAGEPALALSGVGPHLRHVLDFYTRFLGAVEEAGPAPDLPRVVDYDARDRDPRLETDPVYADAALAQTMARLTAAGRDADARLALRVRSDGSPWIESTISRELQSLVSHTVHHFALIAVAVRSQGGDPGPEFGVAPSTLRHWNAEPAEPAGNSGPPGIAESDGDAGTLRVHADLH